MIFAFSGLRRDCLLSYNVPGSIIVQCSWLDWLALLSYNVPDYPSCMYKRYRSLWPKTQPILVPLTLARATTAPRMYICTTYIPMYKVPTRLRPLSLADLLANRP
jgi:hypothetical protein